MDTNLDFTNESIIRNVPTTKDNLFDRTNYLKNQPVIYPCLPHLNQLKVSLILRLSNSVCFAKFVAIIIMLYQVRKTNIFVGKPILRICSLIKRRTNTVSFPH